MSRKLITNDPPPSVEQKEQKKFISEKRSYKLITPLYGGGVEPNKADPITVVRATEIRGHLRFWWRATRGGAFDGDLDKMRRHEEEIWGSAAGKDRNGNEKPGPSKVTVVVKNSKSGKKYSPFEVVPNRHGKPQVKARQGNKVPPYAAFPLQPEQKEQRIGMQTDSVTDGVSFSLEITYNSDDTSDIHAALWAWETFGGIGARTRRGFGALQLLTIEKKSDEPGSDPRKEVINSISARDLKTEVKDRLETITGTWPPGTPHLSNAMLWKIVVPPKNYRKNNKDDVNRAWQYLVDTLKSFRQNRRIKNGKPFGRSYWPEPEAIRKITGDRLPKHAALPNQADKFPRGQFGLPIIFKFKDDDKGEPT
ncbi:MAG: type III-B CRISPR module RAMP protein Cmr1, partial [Planctomycetota bacterium]